MTELSNNLSKGHFLGSQKSPTKKLDFGGSNFSALGSICSPLFFPNGAAGIN